MSGELRWRVNLFTCPPPAKGQGSEPSTGPGHFVATVPRVLLHGVALGISKPWLYDRPLHQFEQLWMIP